MLFIINLKIYVTANILYNITIFIMRVQSVLIVKAAARAALPRHAYNRGDGGECL